MATRKARTVAARDAADLRFAEHEMQDARRALRRIDRRHAGRVAGATTHAVHREHERTTREGKGYHRWRVSRRLRVPGSLGQKDTHGLSYLTVAHAYRVAKLASDKASFSSMRTSEFWITDNATGKVVAKFLEGRRIA